MVGHPSMSFLLDTNIISAHLRRPRGLAHRFMQYSGRLYVSSVALAELYVWAHGKADPTSRVAAIEVMLRDEVSRLDFDDDCARKFGEVRADMQPRGLDVGPVDLLIASVALVYDLTLVTNNTCILGLSGSMPLESAPPACQVI
jgi:tRNA(fMet)-specific endonuclease VapC